MSMGVLTDQKRQLQVGKMFEQAFVPTRRTLRTRRIVPSIYSGAGITKTHRDNCNFRVIKENCAVQIQPVTQAVATCIIPRYPALMDFAPRCLTNDQKPGSTRQLHNGAGAERKFCLTDSTSPHIAQSTLQRHSKHFP